VSVARQTDPATVIRSQVVLEEHDVAADGRFAVVVRRFVQGDRYRSHLWLVPLAGGRARQLTSGPVRDASPRISPDGSAVAFRRTPAASRGRPRRGPAEDPEDQFARLRVVELRADLTAASAPWGIRTPRDRSVGELTWSPDGRHIAFTMDVDPPRFLVGDPPAGDDAPLARRITRLDWRYDESGHLDRWSHLHVVDARRNARPRQVTQGDWGVSRIAWSPAGDEIAFSADPRPDADVRPRTSIWAVAVDASAPAPAAPREVLALGGPVDRPAWSPDGRWIAAVGYVDADARDDTNPELVVGRADGTGAPIRPAPELDRPLGSWIDTDLMGWTSESRTTPCWVDDRTIVAIVSDRGRATPYRFEIDLVGGRQSPRPAPLTDADLAAESLAVAAGAGAPRGSNVTLLACVGSRPMELVTLPAWPSGAASRAAPTIRTSLGSRWSRGLAWPEMRLVVAPGRGGPIETWIASPADAPDAPLATIVDVHGGPLGAWAPAPSIEVVLLCAAGYRVVLPNIRGSTSYGGAWIRPQLNDWGGVDAEDVHAALDHVIALDLADPKRLGVIGLSYGGFMVNWLLGTTDRFRAGISEAGVANQVSAWANGDTSVEFNRFALLGAPLDRDGTDNLWRQSPLSNVANLTTPLLILQGEADQRCPPADNEQLFVALRVLGRPVEYVLYPEESHVYPAAGRPDRRIDRMARMLDWFDRHVKGVPAAG
jgi:dipeptidyl aminopeptidase/acylaminoacyl peptidase